MGKRLRLFINILILSFVSYPLLAEIFFFPLYNRSTEEVLPPLQQAFPNIPISSYGGQLIINTNDISQIQRLIKQLDTPAKRLLVTIVEERQNRQFLTDSPTGYHNFPQRNRRYFDNAAMERQLTTNTNASNMRQLVINEGSPALIQTTQSTPIIYQDRDYHRHAIRTMQYTDAIQKLYVTISLVEQQVYINITSQHDTLTNASAVNSQLISSHISGQLGKWINLSQFQQNSNHNQQNHYNDLKNNNYMRTQIKLKVELAN